MSVCVGGWWCMCVGVVGGGVYVCVWGCVGCVYERYCMFHSPQ